MPNNVIAPGTVLDRPMLFEPLCGLELAGSQVAAGFPGKIVCQSWDCRATNPSLRLSTEEDRLATHFGFALNPVTVVADGGAWSLGAASWFVTNGLLMLNGGRGLLVSMYGAHVGMRSAGGPVEELRGRRKFPDGCSFSRLYAPPAHGDPVLDHLWIPAALQSDFRKLASARVGIVTKGEGKLLIGGDGEHAGEALEILEGQAYAIPAGVEYSLHSESQSLSVVEFAPDSTIEGGTLEVSPSLPAHPGEARP